MLPDAFGQHTLHSDGNCYADVESQIRVYQNELFYKLAEHLKDELERLDFNQKRARQEVMFQGEKFVAAK